MPRSRISAASAVSIRQRRLMRQLLAGARLEQAGEDAA